MVEAKEEKLTVLSLLPVTIRFLPELDTQVSRHRMISVWPDKT